MSKVDYSKINDWYTMAGSSMGEGYEEACHKLLDAALEWQELNPDKNPIFSSFTNVMGYTKDENEAAKEMEKHMLKIVDGCSGAMFQQAVTHFYYIKQNGLDKYYEVLNKKDDD